MSHRLICTLGTSPLVAAEAFLTAPDRYTCVRCLTSDSERVDPAILEAFFARYPAVDFHYERITGFRDLANQAEHDAYEDALFAWYFRQIEPGTTAQAPVLPDVCLAGGFKSMVAALQKAAHLIGADRVFHVLCDTALPDRHDSSRTVLRPPNSLDELDLAIQRGALTAIELGAEPGWPSVRALHSENESADRTPLATRVRARLDEVSRRAAAWGALDGLPFPSLALLGPERRAWLLEPLDPQSDAAWIAALPKIELHCHLGGFATAGPALDAIRAAARHPAVLPPLAAITPPAGWPRPLAPSPLDAYMRLGDNNGSALLKDAGCLDAHIDALYAHLADTHTVYAEIRCSPNNYVDPTRGHASAWAALEAIRARFQHNMDATRALGTRAPHVNLIVIATRSPGGGRAAVSRHLALAITAAQHHEPLPDNACRVVGVDLAGLENAETRAIYYQTDFEPVHRCGLAVTAHAGENDDAEGIWQAVFRLNARRIGHGLRLLDAPDLLRSITDRGIGIEMCPYANYQIKGYAPMPGQTAAYPLREYLRRGVAATINTDNIGISAAAWSDNARLLPALCPGLTRLDLITLLRNAVDQAFLPAPTRNHLRKTIEQSLQV